MLRTWGRGGSLGTFRQEVGQQRQSLQEGGAQGRAREGAVWGLGAGGAGEVRKPGGAPCRGGWEAASLHSQGPGRSQPLCTEDHWWGRPLGAPEWGSSQRVSDAPLVAFLSPMGFLGVRPTPPPGSGAGVRLPQGQAGPVPVPSPVFCSISSSFSSLSAASPHPCRPLCTPFPRHPPISSTWGAWSGAGRTQVLLKRPRELAGHCCWGCAPWPCLGSWCLGICVV